MKINNTKSFIQKASTIHGTKYDYSQTSYKCSKKPIKIICKKCQTIFYPTPSNHIHSKSGCPYCSQSYNRQKKLTIKKFITMSQSVHGNLYDYSDTKYINALTKVSIKCKKCQTVFHQLPRVHLYQKSGCPICRRSHGETKISNILKSLKITFKSQYTFNDCRGNKKPLPFDFYLPKLNICIEYDGKQHSDTTSLYYSKNLIKNDTIKDSYCKTNGIKLIRISYLKFNELDAIVKKCLGI